MKKKILFIILFLMSLLYTGCSFKEKKEITEKIFEKDEFKITLTSEFEEDDPGNYTYFFSSDNIMVGVLKLDFNEFESYGTSYEDFSLEEFINELKETNKVEKYNNLYYYPIDRTIKYLDLFDIHVITANNNSLYEIDVETKYINKDRLEETLIKYAKSIEVKDKVFDKKVFKDNGLEITLTDEFEEKTLDLDGVSIKSFDSPRASVVINKDPLTYLKQYNITSKSTVKEYANYITKLNEKRDGKKDIKVNEKDDLYYYTYDYYDKDDKTSYFYMNAFFKGKDGFYVINLFGKSNQREVLEKEFLEYIKSVKILNN